MAKAILKYHPIKVYKAFRVVMWLYVVEDG